ncbi:hypothetical protein HK103_000375 [Boothiomyces macroporosus]|uniref:Uncharacterized protein n=1 Tax=Boothiomyces macroporosus TaxID=261099 RepID=A0AAD5Y176_9FUNG|nr:hypothetical protein HK103_000375 [Boothiomyces macroporosus]
MNFLTVTACTLLVAAQSTLNTMSTVPVPRDGYHPLSQVQTLFEMTKHDNSKIVAGMQITPTVPTVNLANLPQIQIACLKDSIKLTFKDSQSAKEAYNTWKPYNDLHFMVKHELKCHGFDETGAYHVKSVTNSGSTVSVAFARKQVEEISDEFSLQISHLGAPDNKRGVTSGSSPIHINFDGGHVTNPSVPIFKGDEAQLFCSNCYVSGNVGYQITVSGTRMSLSDYQVTANGNLLASMDLDARIVSNNQMLKQLQIFSKSLDPISVRGLFNVGPSFTVDVGVSYSVTQPIDFVYGFELSDTFSVSAVAHQKPTVSQSPNFKQHPLTISKDIQASVSAHLIPSINLNLEVLKRFTFDAGLPLDTSIGLEYDSGVFNSCSTGTFGVALIAQADLSLTAHGKSSWHLFKPFDESFELYNTGKETLATFCHKSS